MKISIDTKEDSHDHIKEAIALLQSIVGSSASINAPAATSSDNGYVNIFADNPTPAEPTSEPEKPAEQSFFNIFGDDSTPSTPAEPAPEQPTEPELPAEDSVFGIPVAQAAQPETPQADQPTVQTTTPQRAPPTNAPPDVDMFDFFNKSKNQVKPY